MSSIIDNKNKTMLDTLKNSLKQSERVDILTAFFYFSGYNQLAEELRDKKIRILVGKSVEPKVITELSNLIDDPSESLESYAVHGFSKLNSFQKKNKYISSFIELVNKSALSTEFDSTETQKTFKMFLDKIHDGSLEIRLTASHNHAKAYVLTNKPEFSCGGDQKGVVIIGSSNFTYNGLLGQGEMNERLSDNAKYEEYLSEFESLWNDSKSVDICVHGDDHEFEKNIKNKLWLFAQPSPYHIFIRILFELYSSLDQFDILTPTEITNDRFTNLKYQIDAIKYGIDCLNKNNGVIIADVVGLGKSIIAAAIARNLDMKKTIIIAPPHLIEQWNEYQQEFGLRGVRVCSSGKLEEVYKTYASDPDPILYIIDEAHRYRNELSDNYLWLHQLTRSNAENKVILLTATPYNNRPHDLFALIKLFQTPNRSTLNTVDNLGIKFQELIVRYNKLEKEGKKDLTNNIKKKLAALGKELRLLIAPVVVRRSRLDLQEIQEYAEDLKIQKIQFPEVVGPELVEYDLGGIRTLYLTTLEKLSKDFVCARYNPAAYLIDPREFNQVYGELFGEMDIQLFQGNLAKFMKRLLVMRFESSKAAFKSTLKNLLTAYENMKKWWDKGYVPVKKQGELPEPDEVEILETLDLFENEDMIDIEEIKKKAIPLPKNLFRDEFAIAIENDITLLKEIYDEWFTNDDIGEDPKYSEVVNNIQEMLRENPSRKIVIFSTYADTVAYVADKLNHDGYRALAYMGNSSKNLREVIRRNFDASCKQEYQCNDYDIIVATDALSEGFNLNRAGVVINYDIPYNPTRVVQRIGRINRINKKMFEKIYIYNFFPTDIGERNTLIKGISTLKMLLINNIVGSDTKTLTQDETLQSYFRKQYQEADTDNDECSWDNNYRNIYNAIKHNSKLLRECNDIPERARIVREDQPFQCAVTFAKRGNTTMFAIAESQNGNASVVPPETAMKLFEASIDEKSFEYDADVDRKFISIRNEIMRPARRPALTKNRRKAIENLEKLKAIYVIEKDYLNDLLEIVRTYDDLSDGELKYLAQLNIIPSNASKIISELKNRIPMHYLTQIKEKAEAVEAQESVIMFTEDLRNDKH